MVSGIGHLSWVIKIVWDVIFEQIRICIDEKGAMNKFMTPFGLLHIGKITYFCV